ncbi:MAG: cation diffusion facilitator family transporter [Propionibacteriaceae bacterium]|nr:cation diffusion facilitator family transporter [Propionibacteriaceae bacterium]
MHNHGHGSIGHSHGSIGHNHGSVSHGHTSAQLHRKPLLIAFGLTASYMVVEFVVGFWTGSLALISDAAHMGTDVLSLGVALVAITLAARPRTPQRTFGFNRLEVLAAVTNALLLFGVALFVLIEAARRLTTPPDIPGVPLIVTAFIGLIINLISMRLLTAGQGESLNVRGAYLEVLADAIGSVGVIVSAAIMVTTGWMYADPIMGVALGLFILPRTWRLLRQALSILIEAAPDHVDVVAAEADILAVSGVEGVHDLHVWTITSGQDAATAHVTLAAEADSMEVLAQIRAVLSERHNIDHVTVQCEPAGFEAAERGIC